MNLRQGSRTTVNVEALIDASTQPSLRITDVSMGGLFVHGTVHHPRGHPVWAEIDLMHMIRKGQMMMAEGCERSFADQFYARVPNAVQDHCTPDKIDKNSVPIYPGNTVPVVIRGCRLWMGLCA